MRIGCSHKNKKLGSRLRLPRVNQFAGGHRAPAAEACRAEYPPKAEDQPSRGPATAHLPPRTCCKQGLLQLRASGYEGLACGVGGELGEVLNEALCKVFCLLVPLACRGVGVSWVQNLWIYAME